MDLHLIDRGGFYADINFGLDAEVVATQSEPSPELRREYFPVWNLVIDHPEATVLWDTGSHPDAGDGYWDDELFDAFAHTDADEHDLETSLNEVGFAIEDIDVVVQSHLHIDHAGGLYNLNGTDVPVYVHRRELEHAYLSAKTDEGGGGYVASDFDHDLKWRVVHGDRQLLPGVELLHLPGHTPGFLGAHIERNGDGEEDNDDVLIAGDTAFVAENYEEGREMGTSIFHSLRDLHESRRRLKEIERRTDVTVLYGHDPDQFDDMPRKI